MTYGDAGRRYWRGPGKLNSLKRRETFWTQHAEAARISKKLVALDAITRPYRYGSWRI
jgi:hypothetical protein